MEAKLEIQSIWEDDGLFEIRVKGTDGKFAGEIECYTNRDAIEKLANQLITFPKTIEDVVDFSTGEKDNLSYFSIIGSCFNRAGNTKLRIKIAHNEKFSNAPSENYLAIFEIKADPQAINDFGRELLKVANYQIGKYQASLNVAT